MKVKVLIAILLIGFTTQQCSIGCLKCNSLNQCLLCDITNLYFLSGSGCVLSTLTNCALLAQNGGCAQCSANFYLDANSQKCLAVASINALANCMTYNNGQVCVACSSNFFIFGGACVAVNVTVANCMTYSANAVCSGCNTGYLLTNDFSSCITLPTTTNCLYYTYINCKSCNTGFINNPNYYFTNFNSAAYINNSFLNNMQIPLNSWIGLNVCQAVVNFNCAAFSAFNFCMLCNAGFYLQTGNCVLYPLPVISGCLTYSTLTSCSVCQAGQFLGSNICINNAVIANCLVYSGSASTTTCVQCNTAYYLQGNVCVLRIVSASIQNCQTLTVGTDTCASCSSNFNLTSDGRACLVSLANCVQYSVSTYQSVAFQCSLCIAGFYLSSVGSSAVCVTGTVAFCQTFAISSNTCILCVNGYYLANNVCTPQVVIANCRTYDPVKINFCAVCASGFYNFAYTTVCVQTILKNGCVTYTFDGNSCAICTAGYYLASGNCQILPTAFANCAQFSGSQCTLCNTGYMVNTLPTVGTCTLPLDYVLSSTNSPCSITETVATGITPTWIVSSTTNQAPLTCGICNSYMYGYAPQGAEAICVNSNQLSLYSGYVVVPQCSRYGLSYAVSRALICMQCGSGYYISGYQLIAQTTAATTCVSSCSSTTTSSNAIIPDDFLGFVNICIAYVAPTATAGALQLSGTCQRFGRVTTQTTNVFVGVAAAVTGNDFKCFISAINASATLPLNFLLYPSPVATTFYTYEAYSITTPVTVSSDYTMGYSNTVDSTSIVPTVFNYHGILSTITDTTAVLVAANNFNGNTVNNCDILINWATGYAFGGFAFFTANVAPTGTFANVAAVNNYYSCFRCNFGYQLSFQVATLPANNPSFPSCVQMSNCASSTTVYGGLPRFLNSIFSCHLCSQLSGATTYPSIYIETLATNGVFSGFSISNVYVVAGTSIQTANHGFRCAVPSAAITVTDSATATVVALSNCAAYGYITVINTPAVIVTSIAVSTNGQKATCLACAANYYPTYVISGNTVPATNIATSFMATTLLPGWIVASCTASNNCDTSVITQFNSCGKCRSDLVNAAIPAYYAFMDFTATNCYQAFSNNCFILSSTGFSNTATNNACDTCQAGYFLNLDSVCEVYRVPNQATTSSVFVNAWFAAKVYTTSTFTVPAAATDLVYVRKHYLLSNKQLQYGVSSCTSGWVQAPINLWAPRVCVFSSYVYNTTGNYPVSTSYINNCVKYNLTLSIAKNVCGGCSTGYVPTIDGLSCLSSANLANCFFAQTGSSAALCYQCNANYFNVNGQCVSTTIANCATYVNGLWSFTTPANLQCATCLSGFFLSNDFLSCSAGSIINCASYAQGQIKQCATCLSGYVLLTLSNVWYCYPIPATLNCASLQDTSSTSGANYATISCASCNVNSLAVYGGRAWATLALTTVAQTTCMPFTSISNCVSYDQNNININLNSFGCLICATGFWYSASNITCVLRSNIPAQCISFSLTSDSCTACSSGSFLSVSGQQCINFPNGIYKCAIYIAANVCTQCNTGFYINNNACVASQVITNCLIYGGNFTCSLCASGYFLANSSSCVVATATNCLTYTSITACSSCAPGLGLLTTNGVTSCVIISLPNCLNSTVVSPFTCLVCNTGFYPNTNGVCTVVAPIISGCLIYDSATTCVTCAVNSVLNVARTACNSTFYTSLIDANCAQSYLTGSPVCAECSLGSVFVNGTCLSCNNNTLSSGCLSCDPLNSSTCLVCRPQYYMNSLGACFAINPVPTPTPPTSPTINTTMSLAQTAAFSVALISLYFD